MYTITLQDLLLVHKFFAKRFFGCDFVMEVFLLHYRQLTRNPGIQRSNFGLVHDWLVTDPPAALIEQQFGTRGSGFIERGVKPRSFIRKSNLFHLFDGNLPEKLVSIIVG